MDILVPALPTRAQWPQVSTTSQLRLRHWGRETSSVFNANRTTPGKPFLIGLTSLVPLKSAFTSWSAWHPLNSRQEADSSRQNAVGSDEDAKLLKWRPEV